MPNIICPTSIQCPGSDSPILNNSSEAPDFFCFWNYVYNPNNCAQRLTCNPNEYYAHDCFGIVCSLLSQADADLQAQLASVNCINSPIPVPVPEPIPTPTPTPNPDTTCVNEPQTATAYCADGSAVTYTTAAGMFAAPITGSYDACLAAANAQALSYAQQQASALAQLDCPRTSCIIRTRSPLTQGSVQVPYLKAIDGAVTGGAAAFTIVSGSLPPGLTMNSAGLISGTPTTAGTYQFTVQLLNPTQSVSCSKALELTIAQPYWAYFKCDEPSPKNLLADVISASNLAIVLAPGSSCPGKTGFGQAVLLGSGVNQEWTNGPSSHWIIPSDYTVRLWIYPTGMLGNEIILGNTFGWQIQYFGGSDTLEFLVNTTGTAAFVDTLPLTLNTWNHVVFWFQKGVGCGAVVNNGTAITSANVNSPNPAITAMQLILSGSHFMNSGFAVDEIAIWRRKLTLAEIAADWNSGNGVTYP